MKKGIIKISNVIYEEEIESDDFESRNKKSTPDKLTEDKFDFNQNKKYIKIIKFNNIKK